MLPQDAGYPEPTSNTPPSQPEARPIAGRIDPAYNPAPETAPPGLSSGPDFGSLLRSLRRRWMAAATLGAILAVVAGMAAWYFMSPKYTAFAQVRVSSVIPQIQDLPFNQNNATFNTFIRSQAALLRSRPVIHAALKRDDVKKLNLAADHPDVASWLEEELKVDMSENNEFLTLTFSYADPVVATTIVKAISECYMDQTGYGEKNGRAEKIAELEKAYNAMARRRQEQEGQPQAPGREPRHLGPAGSEAHPGGRAKHPASASCAPRRPGHRAATCSRCAPTRRPCWRAPRTRWPTRPFRTSAARARCWPSISGRQTVARTDRQVEGFVHALRFRTGVRNEPTAGAWCRNQLRQLEPQVEERFRRTRKMLNEMNQRYTAQLAKDLSATQELP